MSRHPGKICVDLDGVLAGKKPPSGYADCVPNGPMIQRLRELKALGWTITIHTSRNVKTHDHNVGAIVAKTIPVIIAWLDKHQVPYDELVPVKPWTGEVGFYVDDRAVRPQEFLEMTTSELLSRARGAFFDPSKPVWQAGNDQPWNVIDLRENPSTLLSGDVVNVIENERELGRRTLLVLGPSQLIPIGYDEELKRAGARWTRFQVGSPLEQVLEVAVHELTLEGLASANSVITITPMAKAQVHLKSRHFNELILRQERVSKFAQGSHADKLKFELTWLQQVEIFGENLVVSELTEHPAGYSMALAPGGSLSNVVLRRPLSTLDVRFVADELERLWTGINTYECDDIIYNANDRVLSSDALASEHQRLIVDKSWQRLRALGKLTASGKIPFSTRHEWVVNGKKIGSIRDVVKLLTLLIPTQLPEHRGVFHGDFYPGNMVLSHDLASDDVRVLLIDPRGTIDNRSTALFGDRRYDLAKLCHSLYWGYDGIVAGWRDVQLRVTTDQVEVDYRLWDDHSQNNRLRIWNTLVERGVIGAGDTHLDDPVIHALTALQLLTCAPLHQDDNVRMLGLIARGMDAASYAAGKILRCRSPTTVTKDRPTIPELIQLSAQDKASDEPHENADEER